jgi:protein-L-isoaspartate O-methyltransferase
MIDQDNQLENKFAFLLKLRKQNLSDDTLLKAIDRNFNNLEIDDHSKAINLILEVENLEIQKNEMILEIGFISNFQSFLIAKKAKRLYMLEANSNISNMITHNFERLKTYNLTIFNESVNLATIKRIAKNLKFDRIILNQAVKNVPILFTSLLKPHGKLIFKSSVSFKKFILTIKKLLDLKTINTLDIKKDFENYFHLSRLS